MTLNPGDRIDVYEIVGLIGSGGMGQVYQARDTLLGRTVAIKVLAEEFTRTEERLQRFIAEARAASALNHPNIVTIYGIGETDHTPYIVTELIQGRTVRALLSAGPLEYGQALDIALQTLGGLIKAHSIGIIHRDLKPENLMLSNDGFVKILDFGLAKLLKDDTAGSGERPIETLGVDVTKTGLVMGTASYMSPEQARGQRTDVRTDLFSLGLILYEMLTGENPFRRSTHIDTMTAVLRDEPKPLRETVPSLPSQLSDVVEKAIQKLPEDRYRNAAEMERDLKAVQRLFHSSEHLPTGEFHRTLPVPPSHPVRKKKQRLAGWITVGLLLVAVLAALFMEFRDSTPTIEGVPVIAVMAIDNKTNDPDLSGAEVGRILSDAFVQILYDSSGVQVVSPFRVQSVASALGRTFADTAVDLEFAQEVCKRSNANTILAGSLSQIGQTYILTATLTSLHGGTLIGSFRAEANEKSHLLKILTSAISSSLLQRIAALKESHVSEGKDVGDVATVSVQAYSHFLKALDFNNEGKWVSAVDELRRALDIDPNMAIAWSELACAYSFAGDNDRSKEAQNQALKLRSRMSRKDQLWIDSVSLWLEGNGLAYRKAMEKYTREFPDDRNGHFYIGLGWQWLDGDCNHALEAYEIAYQLTPDYYPVTKAIVDCYETLNQNDRAAASLERYMKAAPQRYGHDQAKSRLQRIQKVPQSRKER